MVLKKNIKTSNNKCIIVRTGDVKQFPVEFQWQLGSVTYTIKEIIDKDPHNTQYKVATNTGQEEIMEVNTIINDLNAPNSKILNDPDDKPEEKPEEKPDEQSS